MIGEKDKIQQAIKFIDKDKGEKFQTKAISYIENEVNGITRFAIMKTTENGRYMRGNMLYYCLNGVEIYTDENNVIFVNTEINTMFVRNHDRVVSEINPTDPEKREYVILYTDLGYEDSSNEFPLRWEAVTGRTMAYESIKSNAPIIDIDKSIVIVETVALKDALSVREFANYMKNSNTIDDESFDINDYAGEYYI